MTVTVNPNVTPSFTPIVSVCFGAVITLPTTSINLITGTWSPAVNNTSTTTYIFTPTAGQCATTALMPVNVNPIVIPTFTQVSPICSGATLAALPTSSTNTLAIPGAVVNKITDKAFAFNQVFENIERKAVYLKNVDKLGKQYLFPV
jgi:hypothetical protein